MDWSKGKILKRMGLNPSEYLDMQLSIVFDKPVFDLNKFEDWLNEKYPADRELSIEECVNKHFPKIAKEIKELFLL